MGKTTGYTLMELLVAVAIMALLAVVTMPRLSAGRPGLETKSAAQAVAEDLSAARRMAVLQGAETRVVFAGRGYEVLPSGPTRTLPVGIALAGSREIDFFADGSTSGGAVRLSRANSRHVVVAHWPSGRIAIDE